MSTAVSLAAEGDELRLAGALRAGSVAALWPRARAAVGDRPCRVDLSGLSACDSAGLAFLVAWRAMARERGGELAFVGAGAELETLARVLGASALLEAAAAA